MFRDSGEGPPLGPPWPRGKLGILTFHRCINYGSYWQARCLAEGLRARGWDAVLLDHACDAIERTELRCAMQPLLPRRSSRAEIAAYAGKTRRFYEAFEQLPTSRRFSLHQPDEIEPCDLAIVGSDEVWNFSHPWYGGRSLFFGRGMPARRVASYAASFGNYDAEAGIDPYWSEHLRRFDAISVRDENSLRLIEGALGTTPALVLDPCLQFPPSAEAVPHGDGTPYVALYGHSFEGGFDAAVRRWADARSLRVVSIGYANDHAHEAWLDAGPLEFASFMAAAAAVATNFFHGCVFALLNEKPFACAVTPYRSNKVRGLMQTVAGERHLIEAQAGEDQLAAVLDAPLSPAIPAEISRLRAQSEAYLQSILG